MGYRVVILTSNPTNEQNLKMPVNQHQWFYDYESYSDAKEKMIDELNKNNNLVQLNLIKIS